MLKAIQRLFNDAEEEASGSEDRRLQVAVALLLHEARRADYEQRRPESEAAELALVEHLWRVTFADGRLELYEDHYVRKIAHLLYVPNTQSMLARNRAKG